MRVTVDAEFASLVPGYMENRLQDADNIVRLAGQGDFEKVRRLGHCMKGSGAAYGFDGVSEIGLAIELAAKEQNVPALTAQADKLREYISNVEVTYDEPA